MNDQLDLVKIRKLVQQLKIIKQPKFYKCPIRNWPLFAKLLREEKIKEVRPGIWELTGEPSMKDFQP